jgi:hypothetical protein
MFSRAVMPGWNKVNKRNRLKYYVLTQMISGRDYAQRVLKIECHCLDGYNQIAGTYVYAYIIGDTLESQSLVCHSSGTRPRSLPDGCSWISSWVSVWNSNIILPDRRRLERRWSVHLFCIHTVVLRVFPILFKVGERGILTILLSCIGTDIYMNQKSLSAWVYVPPTLPPLEPKQTEGHSALDNLRTTLSNSGICLLTLGIFVNYYCVDTRWQQYSTHLYTNNTWNNTTNNK